MNRGIYIRFGADWNIERRMIGHADFAAAGGQYPTIYLLNQSDSAQRIAVHGYMFANGSNFIDVCADIVQGAQGALIGGSGSIVCGAAAAAGEFYGFSTTTVFRPATIVVGRGVLATRLIRRSPFLFVPPGYALRMQCTNAGAAFCVTLWWIEQ